jgi:Electron transfer DM13
MKVSRFMKYRILLLTTLSLLLTTTVVMTGNLYPVRAMPTQLSSTAKLLVGGSFVASEHPTQGLAQIVEADGKKFLKFDRSFKSDNGPDLYVILHNQDPPQAYEDGNYLSLGRLKRTSGEQMYEIPASSNITTFKSVVIWCKQFNATFGFASLE